MEKQNLPIGYYLKKVDQLLTAGINAIHAEFDISRAKHSTNKKARSVN
ncbi:MAG: hypothetical protein IT250_10080 [Chitinophagaceae bacterium]|nr:hypothetical protein [Chitinophagaceae bacterium]